MKTQSPPQKRGVVIPSPFGEGVGVGFEDGGVVRSMGGLQATPPVPEPPINKGLVGN